MKPKRVVFPIAGKGGVGKTTVVATLAEWYADNLCRADLLDMDPDNKAEGSFKALFAQAHKRRRQTKRMDDVFSAQAAGVSSAMR